MTIPRFVFIRSLVVALLALLAVPVWAAPAGAAEPDADFQWALFDTPVSGTTATGTLGTDPFTYTSSVSLLTTPGMFNVGVFPAVYGVADNDPTIRNDVASSNTLTFAVPVRNPMVAFASIGNPSTAVPVQFDRPVEILWSQDTVIDSPSRFTGTEGFVVLRVPGETGSLSHGCTADVPAPGSVTCDLGAVAAGGDATVAIPVRVAPTATAGTTLTGGTVSATSAAPDPVDANSSAQPAQVSVGSASADLALTLDAVPTLRPGETGVIGLVVENLGPSSSGSFAVSYELPLGVAMDSAGANPSGCALVVSTVTCPVAGPLAVGASVDVSIPVQMLLIQPTSGPIPTEASIADSTVNDPSATNNSVAAAPVLDLSGDSDGDGITDDLDIPGDIPGVDVTGEVFRDLNRNGVRDAGEPSLSGVLVSLVTAGIDGVFGTNDDVVVATTHTASPYHFTNVEAGTYEIVVDTATLVPGMLPTGEVDGGSTTRIRLVSGSSSVTNLDFGANHPVITGIFTDDGGRPVPNASIVITDASGATFLTTTGPDGSFHIEGTDDHPIAAGAATISGRTAAGVDVVRTVDVDGVSTVVHLTQQASTVPGELAHTGGSAAPMVGGLLSLFAGSGLLAVSRRRR